MIFFILFYFLNNYFIYFILGVSQLLTNAKMCFSTNCKHKVMYVEE